MNTKVLLLTGLVSVALTACGGGSSGSSQPVNAETGDLKNNAVGSIGSGFDGSLSAVGQTLNRNAAVGNTINDVATGGSEQMGQALPTDAGIQNGVQNWLSVSLATDENTNSKTTRDGNLVNVDPDEEALCREQGLFEEMDAQSVANCTAFFKDVTVSLNATAEEAGVLTYLYQQKPVISLGYAPNSESVELDLGGLKAVLEGIAVIAPDEVMPALPTVMSGSYKFSTTETNTVEGQEEW